MIRKLYVKQFRIFDEKTVYLFPGINILLGKNGTGKTSLLEAVYFMNFSKSFKATRDDDMVQIGKDYFQVYTEWEQAEYHRASGNFLRNKGKRFIFDGETLTKISDVVGSFPMVFQSPEDYRVTSGPGAERRIYFDRIISQVSRKYLQDMMQYRKVLKNRNACLKQLCESKKHRYTRQLEIYDIQLIPLIRRITTMREEVIGLFNRHLQILYGEIFNDAGGGGIRYKPSVQIAENSDTEQIRKEQSEKQVEKEIALKRTLWGPNYDKYVFYRHDVPLIHYASQEKHKIWMTLLKLAEERVIRSREKAEPVFLFDDLFAELDVGNSRRIVENIMTKKQALITTTNLKWTSGVTG
ncbi:MAG: DNA replication and repair protein RecF [Candidatus Marinimicrobia bacterium]|nr:DNA replication and repair protein RecF [Candidatus Neomarinimicrobiota bacterium]